MQIWAFNNTVLTADGDKYSDENLKRKAFMAKSLKKGYSRFGWSWFDGADLKLLEEKGWEEMDDDEVRCYKIARFLWWEIEKGDWIVHTNLPEWGRCMAAQVSGEYTFEKNDNEISDFRHRIPVDPTTIIEFDRNDPNIHPRLSRSLKLQGKHWRIRQAQAEFLDMVKALKKNSKNIVDTNHFLHKETAEHLRDITRVITKNYPAKKLESFIATVFRNMGSNIEVKENGSGWKSDYGADLLVTVGNSDWEAITNTSGEKRLVVQIKSYTGEHHDLTAVKQIEQAIKRYGADAGMIITTADKVSANVKKAVKQVEKKLNVGITVLAGDDVAKFVLEHHPSILWD